jgi:hypothetical protein
VEPERSAAQTHLDLGKLRARLEVEAAREQTYPVCLTSRQCLDLLDAAEAFVVLCGLADFSATPKEHIVIRRGELARERFING